LLEDNPLDEFVQKDMQGLLIALPELIAKKAEGPGGIPGELLVIRINGKTRIVCNMQSNI